MTFLFVRGLMLMFITKLLASAVMPRLHRSVVVKRRLCTKAKLYLQISLCFDSDLWP